MGRSEVAPVWVIRYYARRATIMMAKAALVVLAAGWSGTPGEPPGLLTLVVVDREGCHWTRHGEPFLLPDGTHHCRRWR